uniref:Large ribosomal subunit protein eL28 n=1 Tax=Daphnia similis TaxID=35528 RepID=A0A4Y7N2R2_9CRUS|nr:EOG090X0JNN [Daphnia similis]SVE87146.1 EOG090X0JNN [Daphnia similis]SVE87772.1 EOG090X0JNN [Daphnia similis]SVE88404.1 EOG090X0JNN [Daphnia similis]
MSSSHLQWLITRNTSSFVLKKRNVKQPFSREPLHLTNRHCFKFNTLVHKNVIGVEPAKDKNGFVVVMKSKRKVYKPKASMVRFQIKSGPRHTLAKLNNIVKNGYRKDCRGAVLKKASAIIRSEKTRVAKKAKPAKKAE